MSWLGIAPGMVAGGLIWFAVFRPRQLRAHERRRRAYGLPPKHRLPEDKR